MLNANKERELCYVVTIDEIKPIPGRDRVECAVVGGWTIMVRKDQFKPGDPGIYFEIDSKVPEKEPFEFLAPKHYKIKTQKYKTPEGQFWSQGLLMAAEDFGWQSFTKVTCEQLGIHEAKYAGILDDKGNIHFAETESRFLTAALGVIYADASDNQRKAASADKYKRMAQRHGKLFSYQPFRWLMKRTWGKKLLFVFFGRKKDKKSGWPIWVKKTDEERVQNMPWILENKNPWIATEKIDGTSTTFTIKRKPFGRYDFFICSRNVVFDKPDKKCFYETNVYTEMAKKYDIENKMKKMLFNEDKFADCEWITIQGETYGAGVQKRDYSLDGHDFMSFNLIDSKKGRWNTLEMKKYLEIEHGIPCVPVIDEHFILPDTIEELLNYATGKSVIDLKPREGIVFRDLEGNQSFKAVSNEFLMKYHQ